MSGSSMKPIMGGLQTVLGAGAIAMGQPEIGAPLMMSGVSGLAGGTSGGGAPGGMGSMAGGTGILGSLGNMLGTSATGGFSAPGAGGTPGMSDIAQALQGNPLLKGIDPSQVAGVSNRAVGQPSSLSQMGSSAAAMAPALQAIMGGMQKQPTQPTPPPQTPPPQLAYPCAYVV